MLGCETEEPHVVTEGDATGEADQVAPGEDIWPRAVLLALLVAGASLWLQRHTGRGLDDPFGLLGLTGGISIFVFLVDLLAGKGTSEKLIAKFAEYAKNGLRKTILRTSVLTLLYLAAAVWAATNSSVSVIPPRAGDSLEIEVTEIGDVVPLASETVEPGGNQKRMRMRTGPFGREFRLSVRGFVPKTIVVYPLAGTVIDIEKDLTPLPTLLFRPPVIALAAINDGASFKVFNIDGDECVLLDKSKSKSSMMLGTERKISSTTRFLWNLELEAEGFEPEIRADTLLRWSRPTQLNSASPVEPGDRIYAVVVTDGGALASEALVTASKDPFSDVLMDPPPSEAAACKDQL